MNPGRTRRIAVVPGDGIGQEVIPHAVSLIEKLNGKGAIDFELDHKDWGADRWLKDGVGLPEGALDELLETTDAILFGAVGDPRIPDMAHGREILLGMRFGLDLYANVRPVKVFDPALCPIKDKSADDVNMVIFRENTEGLYVATGGRFKEGTPDEVAQDMSLHTRKGVDRIITEAFRFAERNGRKKVTLVDKSNAIRFSGRLWQESFARIAGEYPGIDTDHLFVDVAAMEMVRAPERFDVVVTDNLFGDILSDIGAGLAGSLGLAASGNLHPGRIGLFEPVHGSAPDIAGQGKANPLATFLSLGMMFDFLGQGPLKEKCEAAVQLAVDERVVTPDLGGDKSTEEVAAFVVEKVMG